MTREEEIAEARERGQADLPKAEELNRRLAEAFAAETRRHLAAMEAIAAAYYHEARCVGLHTVIEHTGLLNEHLKILRRALDSGVDIHNLSVHGRRKFPMFGYEAGYLAEKFACIFSPYLDKAAWRVFVQACEADGCGAGDDVAKDRKA